MNISCIISIHTSDYVPSMNANDTGNVHPGNPGGLWLALRIYAALSERVIAASKDEILAMLLAGTYPGITGANLHPDTMMTGTTGAKGIATGEYATGQTLTIGTTGVAVAASKEDIGGGYSRQKIVLSGSNTLEGNIVLGDTGNISIPSADKGDYFLFSEELIIDNGAGGPQSGLWRLAGATGSIGAIGSSSASDASVVAPSQIVLDTLATIAPKASFGTGASVNCAITLRYGIYDLTANRVAISRPTLFKLGSPSQSPAIYLGGDGILGSNFQMRINGSGSAAAGGTLTIEPGQWGPYGLTFTAKRLYRGGGSGGAAGDQNRGSGELLATINSAGSWSWAHAAGVLVAGDNIFCEVDGISSIGANFTARSNAARVMA